MFAPTHRLLKIFQLVLFSMLFYSIARLEFVLWNASHYKEQSLGSVLWSFVVGLRFDLSAVMMMAAPLLLLTLIPWPAKSETFWRWLIWGLFCLIQLPFYSINLVDVEFVNFVGRRFSFDTLFIFNEVQGKFWNFAASYWHLLSIAIILHIIMAIFAYKILKRSPKNKILSATKKLWLSHAFLVFVCLIIFVIGIRGGLQRKPMSFVSANIFAAPILNNLVLNSTFTIIKSVKEEGIKKTNYFPDKKEMLGYLNGSSPLASVLQGHRFKEKQNVVIIILEGFGAEYLGTRDGRSYTPFLDELSKKSLAFTNAFANARRSIEGIGAIIAGVPALMSEPFISSHFTSNYFLGLGTILGQDSYHTSFFHGANNGSMYFDSFMKSAGVDHYFGANEFPDQSQHDGVWGIWDHQFLPFMIEHLNKFSTPFMSSVFTLTSHQPYKVPPGWEGQYADGPIPILKTVTYTDEALRIFFAEAEKQSWYKDTLFVITADHTAAHYVKDYMNDWGDYHIPLMFFHPRMKWPKLPTDQIVQQIDIMPSVLDFLNLPSKDKNFLGSSVFVPGDKTATVFIDGRYVMFAQDYFMTWAIGVGTPLLYSINDRLEKSPLTDPALRRDELEKKFKATIQYFGEGMWDNKLYYPSQGL